MHYVNVQNQFKQGNRVSVNNKSMCVLLDIDNTLLGTFIIDNSTFIRASRVF